MEERIIPVSQAEVEQALEEFVQGNVLAKGVHIEPESLLRDIGVDSYSVIEMVLFIERRFGVVLPEDQLVPENLKSVRALAACTVKMMA